MALEVPGRQRANVLVQIDVGRDNFVPGAAVEEPDIAPGYAMARLLEDVDEVGADVPFVSGDEEAHFDPSD